MNNITPLTPDVLVNTVNTTSTQRTQAFVATSDGGMMVVWQSKHADGTTYDIMGQKYAADGSMVGSEFMINTVTTGDQENVAITAYDGGFVVTWESDASGDEDIYARQYTNDLTALSDVKLNTGTTGTQWQPDIANNGSTWAVWYDEGRVMLGGLTGTTPFSNIVVEASGIGTNANASITALTGAPGKFVITYDKGTSGTFAKVFDAGTGALSSEFNVGTAGARITALGNGNFVSFTTSSSVYGQIFSPTGAKIGTSFVVADHSEDATLPQAVALSGGGFFVVWMAEGGFGIFGQRFTDEGRALGDVIQVSETTTQNFYTPEIIELPTGVLIVTYRTTQFDGGDLLWRAFTVPEADLDQVLVGTNLDNLIVGDAGGDDITGLGGNDTIEGKLGDDTLDGGTGHDLIEGGAGDDTIIGSHGNDTLLGGKDDDRITGGRGTDFLDGSKGRDNLNGGAENDTLVGGDGKDTLIGGDDNDLLQGDGGKDKLYGNTGNDTLTGGAQADVFFFKTGDGTDIITDFEDGIDRIKILTGADDFSDVTVLDLGADALVVFSDVVLRLEDVDHLTLDATDFIF